MNLWQKLLHELKAVALLALYFGCWLAALIALKQLILAEYRIEFSGMSKVLIGALVLSKVVLVLEYASLGAWVRSRPAWLEVLLRTLLYTLGVLVVLLLEKGFEGRHGYGGFGPSLEAVFRHVDVYHVWVNTICVSGALLVYNALSVIRRHLGGGSLLRLFLVPLPDAGKEDRPGPRAQAS